MLRERSNADSPQGLDMPVVRAADRVLSAETDAARPANPRARGRGSGLRSVNIWPGVAPPALVRRRRPAGDPAGLGGARPVLVVRPACG